MSVTQFTFNPVLDDAEVLQVATSTGLDNKAVTEVTDSWAMIRIWCDVIEGKFGKISSISHHSPPDDPPDLKLQCANCAVDFEHTRLQPEHLGHFKALEKEFAPHGDVRIPSISNPPIGRKKMIEVMFGFDRGWSNISDEHPAAANLLETTLRKKTARLPSGGVIGIADCTESDPELLTNFANRLVNSRAKPDFTGFILMMLYRISPWHFYSAFIEKGKMPQVRDARVPWPLPVEACATTQGLSTEQKAE